MNNDCRICQEQANKIFTGNLLNIPVDYFECLDCGYVQTESPHWLELAYTETINDSDTGIMSRNQVNARIVLVTMLMLGKVGGTLVDYAGGYGILVRLLRDYGINALWSDRYCQNLVARGFERTNETADLVTAFEAFEHFVNPVEELEKMLDIAPNVLFSTIIVADPAPKQEDWWYYGKEHGQHIGFFRIRTLEKLAQERGKFLVSNGVSYHLFTDQPINQTLWKIMFRANRLIPQLLRRRLASKTWSDHLQMAALRK
ncbi:MAG: class I SAM-dependent methyltransferase [Methylococcales bacterium]|nr:class I SAM-dependent methyltransferase [Methylococcales bacterium]